MSRPPCHSAGNLSQATPALAGWAGKLRKAKHGVTETTEQRIEEACPALIIRATPFTPLPRAKANVHEAEAKVSGWFSHPLACFYPLVIFLPQPSVIPKRTCRTLRLRWPGGPANAVKHQHGAAETAERKAEKAWPVFLLTGSPLTPVRRVESKYVKLDEKSPVSVPVHLCGLFCSRFSLGGLTQKQLALMREKCAYLFFGQTKDINYAS